APDDLERRRVLLENVEDVQIRFLSPGGWSDLWEVPAQPGVLAAPQAVAIEIVHPRYGLIETQFVTNAAQ
ncbi:MAG: type II secretion system protein GspJ, partial [Pseudomonadota bacterium]